MLLTTYTAVKVLGINPWIPVSQLESYHTSTSWTSVSTGDLKLRIPWNLPEGDITKVIAILIFGPSSGLLDSDPFIQDLQLKTPAL